jgi:sugar phosphate isomerase/epimerase
MALKEVMPIAAGHLLPVVIENHWGISSRPENIITIVEAVKSPWLGTCPDFGNFPRDVDPYDGLRILAPRALHVQAKSARFDANGEETSIDYRRALRILRDSSYDGTLAIEYEGGGRDLEGCIRTRELILKYW